MTLPTVADHHRAYAEGKTTPLEVAERFIAADPVGGPFTAFIDVDRDKVLAQATASTERVQRGEMLPLEGVLVGIKDFIDVAGYPTRAGTGFLSPVAPADEELVARLQAAGAVIAGKLRATELGLDPLGVNPAGGTPRNPHDLSRPCGGSSSGTAAGVASGLTPVSVGTDGGGSTRIPPSLSGVFGLKPTYGRIPRNGQLDVGWWSLDHPGPLARCAEDLATAYRVMAGIEPGGPDPSGRLRIGVDWRWWGVPDNAVDEVCRAATEHLEPRGVSIPHLELADVAERVTVIAEVATALWDLAKEELSSFGTTTQLTLSAAPAITAVDYLRAQQARTLLARAFRDVFSEVDVVVTPATACTAPRLTEQELADGLFDDELLSKLTAYTFPANLAGFPAVVVPVGTDRDGLPVGLQLMAAWDREEALLALAAQLERDGVAACPPPAHRHDPL